MARIYIRSFVSAAVVVGISSLLAASTAGAAGKAAASKGKPTEVISCREFVALRDEFKPQVVSYALGYAHAKQPNVDLVDVTGVNRLVPVLVKSCQSRPSETLMQRIKAFFHSL